MIDEGPSFENMYIDGNGVIHPCCHPLEDPPKDEEQMLERIGEALDKLVSELKPTRLIYLAFDGVAPTAKMTQQRSRRFRSARDQKMKEELGQPKEWDSNSITPGTQFMAKVATFAREWAQRQPVSVIISDSSVPGEGEHKIMDFVRRASSHEHHVICGQDADLIFLSLALHLSRVFVYRDQLVSVQRLRQYLFFEFEDNSPAFLDDFVTLCFFVGNDFLPQVPCLSIPEGGLDLLLEIYRKTRAPVAQLMKFVAVVEPEILRRRRSIDRVPGDPLLKKVHEKMQVIKNGEVDLRLGHAGFRQRYYQKVFQGSFTEQQVQEMVFEYFRGVHFVSQYYKTGLASWTWHFPYHYAPLACDLANASGIATGFTLGKPVSPLVQLMCVLPPSSAHCLPTAAARLMIEDTSPIKDQYPDTFKLDPNGKPCSLAWLWISLLPFADFTKIRDCFIQNVLRTLTLEEAQRNELTQFAELIGRKLPCCGRQITKDHYYVELLPRREIGVPPDDPALRLTAAVLKQPTKKNRLPCHPDSLAALFVTPPPCRFFAQGRCAYGANCRYFHPPVYYY